MKTFNLVTHSDFLGKFTVKAQSKMIPSIFYLTSSSNLGGLHPNYWYVLTFMYLLYFLRKRITSCLCTSQLTKKDNNSLLQDLWVKQLKPKLGLLVFDGVCNPPLNSRVSSHFLLDKDIMIQQQQHCYLPLTSL